MTIVCPELAERSPGTPTASASELARVLGPLDPDEVRELRTALATAVEELAAAAGRCWSVADDPVVALLRAVARLSMLAPTARSRAAAALVAWYAGGSRPDAGGR